MTDSIDTVSYAKLANQDPDSVNVLFNAFLRRGICYLDLRGHSIIDDIQTAYHLGTDLFSLPLKDKLEYDIDQNGAYKLNGYKPVGRNQGISEGTSDGFEAYLVPRDATCNPTTDGQDLKQPPFIRQRRSFFDNLLREYHGIGLTLLACLDKHLGGLEHKLVDDHRAEVPSTCAFGILKYSPLLAQSSELGHGAHTDVGSLTVLVTTAKGLQFQDPETELWSYVDPRDGHAIINAGDSLRHLSGHRVKSCLHRVVPTYGEVIDNRLSCAYFLRPNLDVEFFDEEGKRWKSVDWHARKYDAFRAPLNEQRKGSVLTGKLGYVGLWNDTMSGTE